MPAFGLPDSTLSSVRNILSDFPAVHKAMLYGSRAKGNFRPGSDIDLTLMGADLDLELLGRFAGRLEESSISYQFGLVAVGPTGPQRASRTYRKRWPRSL
jgi:hypothetical protein